MHLIDICFLPCICLWQISQIQASLCVVVGPGFISTSAAPAFQWVCMVDMHKNVKLGPHCCEREVLTQFALKFVTAVTSPPLVGCVVWSLI